MSMFDNYENLDTSYVPDNSSSNIQPKYETINTSLPQTACNINGTPVGLKWKHGQKFNLRLTVNETIEVAEDSIVYDQPGDAPSVATVGTKGQQAYNLVDCKSWTCIGEGGGLYVWIEDDEVIYNSSGDTKTIMLTPESGENIVTAEVYNFRWELIYSKSDLGVAEVILPVDDSFNDLVKPGTYYCLLKVEADDVVRIKSKTMLIVE